MGVKTKCSTCPITTGCGGDPNCTGRCLRGDDLAEIAMLRSVMAELLDHCETQGDFKNGVCHQGIDEGEVYASGIFDKARAALFGKELVS